MSGSRLEDARPPSDPRAPPLLNPNRDPRTQPEVGRPLQTSAGKPSPRLSQALESAQRAQQLAVGRWGAHRPTSPADTDEARRAGTVRSKALAVDGRNMNVDHLRRASSSSSGAAASPPSAAVSPTAAVPDDAVVLRPFFFLNESRSSNDQPATVDLSDSPTVEAVHRSRDSRESTPVADWGIDESRAWETGRETRRNSPRRSSNMVRQSRSRSISISSSRSRSRSRSRSASSSRARDADPAPRRVNIDLHYLDSPLDLDAVMQLPDDERAALVVARAERRKVLDCEKQAAEHRLDAMASGTALAAPGSASRPAKFRKRSKYGDENIRAPALVLEMPKMRSIPSIDHRGRESHDHGDGDTSDEMLDSDSDADSDEDDDARLDNGAAQSERAPNGSTLWGSDEDARLLEMIRRDGTGKKSFENFAVALGTGRTWQSVSHRWYGILKKREVEQESDQETAASNAGTKAVQGAKLLSLLQATSKAAKKSAAAEQQSSIVVRARFSAGTKVKARWLGGSRWYPGRIHLVHTDECCDIQYDDGEHEARVEPKYIRLANQKSGPTADRPQPKEWSKEEKAHLVRLVCEDGPGRWEDKALELNTNRTATSVANQWNKVLKHTSDAVAALKAARTQAAEDEDEETNEQAEAVPPAQADNPAEMTYAPAASAMTEVEEEHVVMVTACTGCDEGTAIQLLNGSGWAVESAVTRFFDRPVRARAGVGRFDPQAHVPARQWSSTASHAKSGSNGESGADQARGAAEPLRVSEELTEEDLNELEAHIPCTRKSIEATFSWIDTEPGEMPAPSDSVCQRVPAIRVAWAKAEGVVRAHPLLLPSLSSPQCQHSLLQPPIGVHM